PPLTRAAAEFFGRSARFSDQPHFFDLAAGYSDFRPCSRHSVLAAGLCLCRAGLAAARYAVAPAGRLVRSAPVVAYPGSANLVAAAGCSGSARFGIDPAYLAARFAIVGRFAGPAAVCPAADRYQPAVAGRFADARPACPAAASGRSDPFAAAPAC